MILCVVAIRDAAANAYNRPFVVPHTGLAIRSFGQEVNRNAPDNLMYSNPSDFELFELGTFDEETGSLSSCAPRSLARGVDHRVSE